MTYRGDYQRAVIVSTIRSGSTFLAHCLDNHPHIGCERGEVLHPTESPFRAFADRQEELITALLSREGFKVNMIRMIFLHALHLKPDFWHELGVKAIVISRPNAIRAVVSRDIAVQRKAWNGFEKPETIRIKPDPAEFVQQVHAYRQHTLATAALVAGWAVPTLYLTYDELKRSTSVGASTHLSKDVSTRLREFLGITTHHPFYTLLRRQNPEPLNELVANWGQVETKLALNGFGWMLHKYGLVDG